VTQAKRGDNRGKESLHLVVERLHRLLERQDTKQVTVTLALRQFLQ
jgi:hypothetical protein